MINASADSLHGVATKLCLPCALVIVCHVVNV